MRKNLLMLALMSIGIASCGDAAEPTAARVGLEPGGAARSEEADDKLFEFERMFGNQGPFLGAAGAIRGIPAGGAPWTLSEAEAKLDVNGQLHVEVEGLIVIPRGSNPATSFRAVLSCETFDASNTRQIVNLFTRPVPTDLSGDAEITETLEGIPSPCYAPMVFVVHGERDIWFAVSGF